MGELEITCMISYAGLAAVVSYELYRGWRVRFGQDPDSNEASDELSTEFGPDEDENGRSNRNPQTP